MPLAIDIIEPRPALGAGLAYGSCGTEHRLNVPADRMIVSRDAPSDFADWLRTSGEEAKDPRGRTEDGSHYPRRAVFGQYMAQLVRGAQAGNVSGSAIRHVRKSAETIEPVEGGWRVGFGDEHETYRNIVLAVTHSRPAIPWAKVEAPNIIEDPWEKGALDAIAPDASIVIAGSGLTMCDVVVSLRERGHRGKINVISRRGLTPRPQNGFAVFGKIGWQDTPPQTASELLLDLRRQIRAVEAEGGVWQSVLNAIREQLPQFWTKIPLRERARIVKHLRPYWDVHRFRAAPQVSALLEQGKTEGWLEISSGRIHGLTASNNGVRMEWTPRGGKRGVVVADFAVNCTGPDANIARSSHAIIRRALADGVIRRDALGMGIDVDARGRAYGGDGELQSGLWVAGPMARAYTGDATGLPDVSDQVRTIAESLAAALADRHRNKACAI
ncbi:FAD-dependent oxidoreductase [Terrihabitans soli]|uniref:FAD-dependent oxidoreductase n=2 Tax=Terrihabitans soli TaxID=708113 RepID=A0A6S6QL76_9HYPH|nr:FAD-dependent oxidoreductase [Terrihabitans soli]